MEYPKPQNEVYEDSSDAQKVLHGESVVVELPQSTADEHDRRVAEYKAKRGRQQPGALARHLFAA